MKSIAKICFAALVISAAFSCTKEALVEKNQQIKEGMMPYEATISMDATKASLDGKTVVWTVGDKVAIYDGVNADANEFQVVSASGNTATITGQISQEATNLWGVFPFSAAAGLNKETDFLTVNVPATQEIATGKTIAADALVSVSKAAVGATLNFKNAVSLVKFTLPIDGVKRVVFSGSTGATGAMEVKVADALTLNYSGTTALTVSKADGFAKNTAYYATVFAQEQNGVKFVLTTADYKSVVSSDKAASFAVNAGLNFTLEEAKINAGKFPLNIKTKDDLLAFGTNGSLYDDGEWVTLCDDINYEGGNWEPAADFAGNFDGQNHSIYNIIFITNVNDKAGFIGRLTSSCEIKDLKLGYSGTGYDGTSKITVSAIKNNTPVIGAFAAAAVGDNSKFTNLVNYLPTTVSISSAPAKTSFKIGGIVGQLGKGNTGATVKSCNNYGDINMEHTVKYGTHSYFGGIVGLVNCNNCTFDSCTNFANIEGAKTTAIGGHGFIGGILARPSDSNSNLEIVGCVNEGTLNVTVDLSAGGPYIGGILGADNASVTSKILTCTNKGQVSSNKQTKGSSLGGIVGFLKAASSVQNCENKGKVIQNGNCATNSYIGGIAGKCDAYDGEHLITGCTNNGEVADNNQTSQKTICLGGIAGTGYIDVVNCYNYASISMTGHTAALCAGGILGLHASNKLTGCVNEGNVSVTLSDGTKTLSVNSACGGLIGRQNKDNNGSTYAEGCQVNCTVSSPTADFAGMVLGNYNEEATVPCAITYGSVDNPVKVAGKFNETDLTSENYTSYIFGRENTSATFNTAFYTK